MRSAFLRAFCQAAWLDGRRARAWRDILLAMSWLAALAWIVLARDGLDLTGKPLGTDFLSFYAASKLALGGDPAAAYQMATHRAAEISVFGRDVGYAAFFYPPLFLLVCAPLAALPYLAALAAWLAATGAAFAASLRGWLDRRLGWSTVAAFPAVLMSIGHGQNAFLSAALLGSGAMWLESRPLLAGAAFGLVAFKPHLGLMLPLALAARGRWKVFGAAAVTVAGFAAASLAAFGPETWRGFLAGSALARATLEQGLVEPGKMVSAFAAVRVLGGPIGLAYATQGLVTLVVAAALVAALRRRPGARVEGVLIIQASLLASPFLLDYDLVALAFPLAWLAGEGVRDGFQPGEKAALLVGFLLPLVARVFAVGAHIPLAPAVLLALFALVLRRAASADEPRARRRMTEINAAASV
jgi:hypothetical protein